MQRKILQSLNGIALCVVSITFATLQNLYLSIPFAVIGIIICLNAYYTTTE